MSASPATIRENVSYLTETIGVRLAGSAAERQAADYIADQLGQFATNIKIEEYPVMERYVTSEKLEVCLDGQTWENIPCSLFGAAPTTDGKTLEAEVVFFDTATGYQFDSLDFLTGKAVVHLGCHIFSEDCYRRLIEAKPAFILFIDTRYPANIPLADGLFPAYVAKFGAVPSLNVAYMDAWRMKTGAPVRARVCVAGSLRPSMTTVVTADIPGTDPEAGIIYLGGHHDTQAGTVGADDNASGVATALELGRQFAKAPLRPTIRICSFGAEEQLSVASAGYIRAHRREISDNGLFMLNFDSLGSRLGWTEITINGSEPLRRLLHDVFHRRGLNYVESCAAEPFTDQFPFAACGVPGCWLTRKNCLNGLFFHHRADNTIDKLDFQVLADYVDACAAFLSTLSAQPDLAPFRTIPADQMKSVMDMFNNVHGGF